MSARASLSAEYVDYAINHVLSTGQSNSVGNGGAPALTTQQPYESVDKSKVKFLLPLKPRCSGWLWGRNEFLS